MEPFADPGDVQSIWRELTDDEVLSVASWIDQASQQVRDEVPDVDGMDVDERIADGSLDAKTVRDVVSRMVRRVVMNPEGLRQRSRAVDDYTESGTVDSSRASGELFISSRELKRLMGVRSGGRRAFTVDTSPDRPIVVGPTLLSSGFNGWF